MTENNDSDFKNGYKAKGFQKMSLEEYAALQQKQAKKRRRPLPKAVTTLFSIPFFIICLLGLFFIPYILFTIAANFGSGKKSGVFEKNLSGTATSQ